VTNAYLIWEIAHGEEWVVRRPCLSGQFHVRDQQVILTTDVH
jgi:hypothetical protein